MDDEEMDLSTECPACSEVAGYEEWESIGQDDLVACPHCGEVLSVDALYPRA
mgnify:CR=1 FL=1